MPKTKVCAKCRKRKKSSLFGSSRWGLQSYCKACQRNYMKTYYRKNTSKHCKTVSRSTFNKRRKHREITDQIKSVPCKDCNQSFPPYVMDFDHINPKEKEFTICEQLGRYATKRILREIEKCEVVCANCHRIRTHNRRVHGPTAI